MTVREVLDADWTVDHIEITVRDEETSRWLERYLIGENLMRSKWQRLVRKTKAGDLYIDNGMRYLYIDNIIQHKHLPKQPRGTEGNVGVVLKNIPAQLLDLKIEHMSPDSLGSSDDMHGYGFDCYVPMWFGIPGEHEERKENTR